MWRAGELCSAKKASTADTLQMVRSPGPRSLCNAGKREAWSLSHRAASGGAQRGLAGTRHLRDELSHAKVIFEVQKVYE